MFILVEGSSKLPFIGIGTLYINFSISFFSSSRIGIKENSFDIENKRKMSISDIFSFKF